MKTTEEMISVMTAYSDGKEIEFSLVGDNVWSRASKPTWNWHECDYRVKPEQPQKKEIVPYESAEEFLAAQKEHGPYVLIETGVYRHPESIDDTGLYLGIYKRPYPFLLVSCKWQDGTPCGKEVEV